MITKLHRLYRRRLADQNIIDEYDELNKLIHLDKQDVGINYHLPTDEAIDDSPPLHDRRGEAHSSSIIALKPTKEAALAIADDMSGLDIDPNELHITLVYLGEIDTAEVDTILNVMKSVAELYSPLDCKIQGLGLFDGDESEDNKPFYASVDAIGMAEMRTELAKQLVESGINIPSDHDFTPHMTLAYLPSDIVPFGDGSPAVEWTSNELVLMHGNEHISIKFGEAKTADIGNSLTDLTNPGVGSIIQDEPSRSYRNENQSEDVDLHLGKVEAPYTDGLGPMSPNIDDDHRYNIERGANIKMSNLVNTEKESVAIIDSISDENKYTDGDETRQDRSIPLGGPLHGH